MEDFQASVQSQGYFSTKKHSIKYSERDYIYRRNFPSYSRLEISFFLSVILAFALANNNYIEKIEGPLHTFEIRQPDKTTQQHQFSFLSTPLKS